MRLLISIHAWRTIGPGFIILYAFDQLPAAFAFPAGRDDAFTAVTAVFLVSASNRSAGGSPTRIWVWNTFGQLDFIVAVTIGALLRSNPAGGATNADAMTIFLW